MNKCNKGITLIALVITIVILLILAGITIASLNSENGLFERSKEARNETKNSIEKENKALGQYENTMNDIIDNDFNIDSLINEDLKNWIRKANVTITVEDIIKSEKLLEENGLKLEDITDIKSEKVAKELIQNTSEKQFTFQMAFSSVDLFNRIKEKMKRITVSNPISSGDYNTSWKSSYAFDNDLNSAWCNIKLPSYVGCKTDKPTNIYFFEIYTGTQSNCLFKDFTIQGSNDNVNWEDLTERIDTNTEKISTLAYAGVTTKNTDKSYLYLRAYFTKGGRDYSEVSELYFYEI